MPEKKRTTRKSKIHPSGIPDGCWFSEYQFELRFEGGPKDGFTAVVLHRPPEKIAFQIRKYAMDDSGKLLSKKKLPEQWHVYKLVESWNFTRVYRFTTITKGKP